MQFKPITLEDKQLFDSYFEKYPPEISELTFTNLFVWQSVKNYEYAIKDNHLIISFKDKIRKFLQPIGKNPHKIIEDIFNKFPKTFFERVDKSIAEKLKTKYKIFSKRDHFDYIYSLEELRELKGRKFESKRNFVKQCLNHNPKSCLLNDNTSKKFLELQEKWCNLRNCEKNPGILSENIAIRKAIDHFKELNLFGVCII
jgi:hypothetical protein